MLTTTSPTSRIDAEPQWYFRLHGLIRGPIGWDELQRLAEAGTLKPSDAVRRGEDGPWVVASRARNDDADGPAAARASVVGLLAAGLSAADEPAAGAVGARTAAEPVPSAPASASAAESGIVAERPAVATAASPPPAARPAAAAILALGLSLVGLFALALPLGMLALYLGGPAAARLVRADSRGPLCVAALAVAVGLVDVGVSLAVLGRRLIAMPNPFGG